MGSWFFIYPILLLPSHTTPPENFPSWPSAIKRTGLWTIAKGLESVLPFWGIPMINDYVNRHFTSPNTAMALQVVCPGCEPLVPPQTICFQSGNKACPWWLIFIYFWTSIQDPQLTCLIIFGNLLHSPRVPPYYFAGRYLSIFSAFLPSFGNFHLLSLSKVRPFPNTVDMSGTTASADFSQ